LFGYFAYLIPIVILYGVGVSYVDGRAEGGHSRGVAVLRWIGCLLIFGSGSGLASILLAAHALDLPYGSGGMLGNHIGETMLPYLSTVGSVIALVAIFLVGLTLFSGVSWLRYSVISLRAIFGGLFSLIRNSGSWVKKNREKWLAYFEKREAENPFEESASIDAEPETEVFTPEPEAPQLETPPVLKKTDLKLVQPNKAPLEIEQPTTPPVSRVRRVKVANGDLPSLDLLDEPEAQSNQMPKEKLEEMAALVEQKLADFNITAKVVGACPGPIVTRYELQLAPGTKVSKLNGLSKDIARSLAAHSVRIVDVIPGKSVVGLEIPNPNRETVRLKEVLLSRTFQEGKSPLLMGLGKDIAGDPEIVNLDKMPHLLVAGTTGSGKSVGVNAMILSMLFKAPPNQLRFIMIDPKMLELSVYEGIPHLLTPVVTDMKEAANALRWCVREMDRRYRVMAAIGVRNIAGLNEKLDAARSKGKAIKDPIWPQQNPGANLADAPDLEDMPYIVVVVDEFADLMMVAGKKVEELIARLAQKARAAGVHLILATQRPSVDVITGLIKANIPTRIAFQVSSRIDSRTILDQQGAEQLLGNGDMLYMPPGTSVPIRVHGAFVGDHEIHAVAQAWKDRGAPEYIESITVSEASDEAGEDGERDPLYDEAVQIVLETQRASISGVQRRLKIGYNRAARLLEQMEAAGLVSEIQSNGLREILVSNQ